jgi:hypothetical protein
VTVRDWCWIGRGRPFPRIMSYIEDDLGLTVVSLTGLDDDPMMADIRGVCIGRASLDTSTPSQRGAPGSQCCAEPLLQDLAGVRTVTRSRGGTSPLLSEAFSLAPRHTSPLAPAIEAQSVRAQDVSGSLRPFTKRDDLRGSHAALSRVAILSVSP